MKNHEALPQIVVLYREVSTLLREEGEEGIEKLKQSQETGW